MHLYDLFAHIHQGCFIGTDNSKSYDSLNVIEETMKDLGESNLYRKLYA